MTTTSLIFRKHNFLLIDALIHNDSDYSITGKMFANPLHKVFDKPTQSKVTKKTKK